MRYAQLVESTDSFAASLQTYLTKKGFVATSEATKPNTDQGYGHKTILTTTTYELVSTYDVFLKIEKYLTTRVKNYYKGVQKPNYVPFTINYDYKSKAIIATVTIEESEKSDLPSITIPYYRGPFSIGDQVVVGGTGNKYGVIGFESDYKLVTVKGLNGDTYTVSDRNGRSHNVPVNSVTGYLPFYSGAEPNRLSKIKYKKFTSLTDFTNYRLYHNDQQTVTLTGVAADGKRYMLDTGYIDQIMRKFIDRNYDHMLNIPKSDWWNTLSDQEKADYAN